MKFNPVIISGGAGTRLWPVSRTSFPKQFIPFFEESLFTQTLLRVKDFGSPWVVTTEDLRILTEKVYRGFGLPLEQIIFEPFGKNTAAAIAVVCRQFELLSRQDEIIGIFPADHQIANLAAFKSAVTSAIEGAKTGSVVTLGLRPTHPATGFGYIELQAPQGAQQLRPVTRFCEKPNMETAQKFLEDGNYVWNAGMFFFKVETMIAAFKAFAPEIWKSFEDFKSPPQAKDQLHAVYEKVPSISVDYAIMEKLKEQVCVPCDLGWNDLGCWDDLFVELGTSDKTPKADIEVKASGNKYFSMRPKTTAFVGVEDLLVVDTDDAILICHKGDSQNVKDVVDRLKTKHSPLVFEHKFEIRPWGKFEILRDEEHYKSKIITIDPKAAISYQSHEKREELWVIVRGEGEVLLDEQVIPVRRGQSVRIPVRAKHRIKNTGIEPLEFIEVQTGTYFGEDDIKRYQDDYGRS